ncbi:putative actin patch assembly and actin polymerization protein [Myotisia sp. PD_48]|nr:putative actin patch assembly and actin polymerization protein [Myotisia sp. PD_48]
MEMEQNTITRQYKFRPMDNNGKVTQSIELIGPIESIKGLARLMSTSNVISLFFAPAEQSREEEILKIAASQRTESYLRPNWLDTSTPPFPFQRVPVTRFLRLSTTLANNPALTRNLRPANLRPVYLKKPYTAVTVLIDNLTSEQYETDDWSGIVDLVEAIQIQTSGPTEASRALRKKLKYGTVHKQLRALTILDFLIQNAGERFLRKFADEPLLERLRVASTDPLSDPAVRTKCKQLFPQWAISYKGVPGMERITQLYAQLPKRKQPMRQQQSKVLKETEEPEEPPMGHSVSVSAGSGKSTMLSEPGKSSPKIWSKRNKESRRGKSLNIENERPEILQAIAAASVASTNLMNALKFVNREDERVSENPDVVEKFNLCKTLRRQLLRYIQHIESEDFLGSLIHANEELVNALMTFEVLDKSVDYDSDSEEDMPFNADYNQIRTRSMSIQLSGLKLDQPRSGRSASLSSPPVDEQTLERFQQLESDSEQSEDDDIDNPFGDRNAIKTPAVENPGPTWYVSLQHTAVVFDY